MAKKPPMKRNPLFSGDATLPFELETKEKLLVITDQDKASDFLSRYQAKVHPLSTYEKYFKGGAKEIDHIFNEIKNFYTRLVIRGDWTERKYVTVLNDILENRAQLSVFMFDRCGQNYEKGLLASQRRIAKAEKERF